MLVKRLILPKIKEKLFKGKAIIIYGARQVGKTTLLRQLEVELETTIRYVNCDEPDVRVQLEHRTSTELKAFLGPGPVICLDEAQRVRDIGLTIKLLVDTFPDFQIIATGSSSFELANKIVEPLTGRVYEFFLYPLSVPELSAFMNPLELRRLVEQHLIYGMYPEIITRPGDAAETAKHLARSYAYKDLLAYQDIRHPEAIEKLVAALALQIGHEVSYTELGRLAGINRLTVEKYIRLLEQAFIVFRLRPFSRNPRKELAKLNKIYFYDTGLRNAIINNFNPAALRNDMGQLWENWWIVERLKFRSLSGLDRAQYFWRTYAQQEVDLVEEAAGRLEGFECKWGDRRPEPPPREWSRLYPNATYTTVTPNSFLSLLGIAQ